MSQCVPIKEEGCQIWCLRHCNKNVFEAQDCFVGTNGSFSVFKCFIKKLLCQLATTPQPWHTEITPDSVQRLCNTNRHWPTLLLATVWSEMGSWNKWSRWLCFCKIEETHVQRKECVLTLGISIEMFSTDYICFHLPWFFFLFAFNGNCFQQV